MLSGDGFVLLERIVVFEYSNVRQHGSLCHLAQLQQNDGHKTNLEKGLPSGQFNLNIAPLLDFASFLPLTFGM